MKVRGFAELTFDDSAGLSFARAVERAATDPSQDHPAAWEIDERRISFSLDADLAPAQLQAHRRLLEELLREAASGEARLEAEGSAGRWEARVDPSHAAPVKSSEPRGEHSDFMGGPDPEEHPTIRTGTRTS